MKDKIGKHEWFTIIGLLVFVYISLCASCFREGASKIEIANFIAVSLTLFVLVKYAYDTNRIANIEYRISYTPIVTHEIRAEYGDLLSEGQGCGLKQEIEAYFKLGNLSHFDVEILVWVDIFVDDKRIEYFDDATNKAYQGITPWVLCTLGVFEGHFTFGDGLLEKNNIDSIIHYYNVKDDKKRIFFKVSYHPAFPPLM